MKITETYQETITHERVIRTVCDKCGKEVEDEGLERHDFEMEYRYGTYYPECGNGKRVTIEDLCHEHALEVFAILEAAGFRVTRDEWDY